MIRSSNSKYVFVDAVVDMIRSSDSKTKAIGVVLMVAIIAFALFMVTATVYGLILAFGAGILIGLMTLLVSRYGVGAIFGIVMAAYGKNLPEAIMGWLQG